MIESATEVMIKVFVWAIRFSFISMVLFATIVILNLSLSMIQVSFNIAVLNDLFGLIQLWLPFNLNVVLVWFSTASILYVMYRLSVVMLSLVNKLIGNT